ncbi:uncharacterized protein LOC128429868 [Pleuronectes platessa]|uniref:uncharacterized protein LOC128429868 n=1 Tax=Pleuronectes platessa TaxID=8262 RepID=UPI00232A0A35|nr:uncharacterized protein LOC128429868 [Pleuronectes platessa]
MGLSLLRVLSLFLLNTLLSCGLTELSNRSFVVLQHNWTQIFSGETISVRCEIQGGGDTQWEYEWRTTSSHQPVTGPNTAPTHSEYRLGPASVFHSGEYWCKARADWYSSTEWSEAFQLRVTPDKPRPRLTADNTTITGKGSVALTCSVENASEWRYDWFRRTSASSAAQILRYNETDDELSISEEGIYSCRGRRGDTSFLTEDSNRVSIENRVSHKASVVLQPDWSLVFSGERITVRCEVPADELTEWEYEWTKPNSTTAPTHNEHRIVNVSSSDSGSYRCLAKDKKNLNSTTEWSDDVTLTVSERPVAHLSADHRAFPVGGSVLLTCSVGPASPGWKYYWFRGEKTSEPLTDEDFKSRGQSASASREGLYWCRGGRGDPVYYTQYSHPVRIHGIVHNTAAVTLQPNWPSRYRGEAVTLRCEIQGGDSEWEYEWTATSSHAPPNTKEFRTSLGSDLSGSYWCQGRLKGARQNSTGWSAPLTLSNAAAPRPVLTVSPSWLTPGASGTLTCGGLPHPTAGWRFYWYRADTISLDQAPKCLRYGSIDIHFPEFSYELLPGSDGGTEQNSFIIQGLTESAGYSCRAGRGDPVFYTEYSNTEWVWPVDSYSSVSLTVKPDSVQHFIFDNIPLTCEGNSDKWRFWMSFGDRVLLSECKSQETITSYKWNMYRFPSGVVWCGSGSEISNAVNISTVGGDVILESPVHPVTEGQSVTLGCSWFRRTNLYSNISFYKNDELLQSDDRRKLEISAVSKSDEGFYKCEHSGDFSEESWMSVKSAAPPPVLTVSPSWLTPGASGTLTCGGVPHPTAGWRFYWYRADTISLDQAPSCSQSIRYGRNDLHIPDKFSYELLPGSDGGTEQNSFIIQDLTESAGYSCRAGRGDPVFYTEYSNTTWVWPVDSNSSVSLTVSPDSVQHRYLDIIRLTCEGNSDKWRLWMFTGEVRLFECESQETSITWTMDYFLPSGVYWCGSGSEISNAVNISSVSGLVILKSPVHPVTEGQSVSLGCLWFGRTKLDSNFSFYKNDELLQSDVRRELEISAVSKSDEGFYKCEHSGDFSEESWMSVKLTPAAPPSASPVLLVVGLVGGFTLILLLLLLLLCCCRNSKNLCCDRLSQSLRTNQSSDPTVHHDEVQLPVYSSLLHGDDCIYDSIRGDTEEGTRGDPEETSDYVNENPHSASGGL